MNDYFGDVIIYKGNGIESKILKPFTGEWTHTALRINRGTAQSLDFWGKLKHDLYSPNKIYDEYIILRHKDINKGNQKSLSRLNRMTKSEYDLKLLFNLAFRKIMGYESNQKDISNPDKSNCSTRVSHMFDILELRINWNIHYSQIEPHHFLESQHFEQVGEWKRG